MLRIALFLVTSAVAGAGLAESAPLVAEGPNPKAPEAVKQYGQLQGDWRCTGSSLQADGSWKDNEYPATWSWYYVLDGHAVQDVWQPSKPGAPTGTNLRTYDAEKDRWYMVWATASQPRFDHFEATFADGRIVMTGDRWAREAFQAHQARITFFNIGDDHYDWKYEFSSPGDGENWTEQSRLSCDRI